MDGEDVTDYPIDGDYSDYYAEYYGEDEEESNMDKEVSDIESNYESEHDASKHIQEDAHKEEDVVSTPSPTLNEALEEQDQEIVDDSNAKESQYTTDESYYEEDLIEEDYDNDQDSGDENITEENNLGKSELNYEDLSYDDQENYEETAENEGMESEAYDGEGNEGEAEYEDDVDTLYRNYEILSEFYQKHYVDLRVLDDTCEPSQYPAPNVRNGIVKRYERVDNVLLPGKQYRQAIYACNPGYVLSDRTSDSMFCQEYGWQGLEPECEQSDEWSESANDDVCARDNPCPQECRTENGQAVCYCSSGFVEGSNGSCEDVDECLEDNGGCDEDCTNKPGSYMCTCPPGYELAEDNHACVDTNECLGNNGHGRCQDTCVNTDGSYYCSCDNIEGSKLASDGHTCEVMDMCADNNAGCSHGCYSAQGRAYCTCPEGWQLGEDWRQCHDIDECVLGSPCEDHCINTPGSYSCVSGDCAEDEMYREGVCEPRCGADHVWRHGQCELQCSDGYQAVGGQCVRVCEEGTVERNGECEPVCSPGTCHGHGQCHSYHDQYQCQCEEGYSGDQCQCGPGFRHHDGLCLDIDECYELQPCSQLCNNTQGSYQCYCQDGFLKIPGSQDVCKDIDECNLKPAICEQGCVNSPGGFQCVCQPGYVTDPEDSTKCVAAGCPALTAPEGGVLNCSPGSHAPGSVCHLECHQGFVRFGKQRRKCLDNGTWEEGVGWCQKVTCPPIQINQFVQVYPESCLTQEQTFKSKCRLSCARGFSFEGSRAAFCGKRNKWIFRNGPTRCLPTATPPAYSQIPAPESPESPVQPKVTTTTTKPKLSSPYIVCPPDITLNLTGQPPLLVNIARPKTNVDWETDVVAAPANAKSLSYYQEPGDMEVLFEARNTESRQVATCKVKVTVKDVAKPSVTYCPQSRSVFLEPEQVDV